MEEPSPEREAELRAAVRDTFAELPEKRRRALRRALLREIALLYRSLGLPVPGWAVEPATGYHVRHRRKGAAR